jgi:ABC-2 type transport system ATP-binding protein
VVAQALGEHRVRGRTLLVATADLADAESLCPRLLVADHGRVAYDGTLRTLSLKIGGQRIMTFDLVSPQPVLDDVPGTELIRLAAGGLRQQLAMTPGETTTARVLADVATRVEIRNFSVQEPALDDVIRLLAAAS